MHKFLILALLLFGRAAWGQSSSTGSITGSSTTCASTTTCITLTFPGSIPIYNGASVTLAGTFSATLQPEVSGDGGNTWVSEGAALSSTGLTQYTFTGITAIRVRCTSFVSGSVTVTIQGQASSSGSGSSGSAQNTAGTAGPNPQFGSWTIGVTSGGSIYARNNSTGNIDSAGTDAAVVINALMTTNAAVGGKLYFKNGVYNINSMTEETATGCSSFGGSGNKLAYAFGVPSNASYATGVQWFFEGESSPIWTGELLATTVAATGVVFNVTSTAVSSVTANDVLTGFWQRPATNCTLTTNITNNNSNDLYFKNLTLRFPVNTRGNEIAFAAYFAGDVQYRNVLADFNVSYNTIATGSAPTVGSYNSIGFTTTVSGSGNWMNFEQTYAVGYNIGYDFQSEHVSGNTVTAIYNNIACEFGRSAGALFHPSKIDNFVDQENGAGCIWGNQIQQGTFFDVYFDFEFGGDANWYSTARGSTAKLSETPNTGYATGLIRYQAVLAGTGVVAEIPAATLFTSGGTGFQALEATNPPNIALTPLSDTFTRPNNNGASGPPASCASGGINGIGPQWLNPGQTGNCGLRIVSNAAEPNFSGAGAQTGYSSYAAQTVNPDQFSKIQVASINASASSFVEVSVRNSTSPSTQTYYTYYCGGTAAAGRGIIKVVAGASTTLVSQTSAGCVANDTLELRVIGTFLYAYYNGALDTTFTNPTSDSSITSGQPGIIIVQSATTVVGGKNWSGGSFPTMHGTDSIYNNIAYHTAYNTVGNCAAVGTAASPSVASCGASAAGHFSCATNATGATCQVNTTAVTPASEIFVFESDATAIGTLLGVTCNTSTTVNPATRLLASQTAGTGFVINLGTVTTNPACFAYHIIN